MVNWKSSFSSVTFAVADNVRHNGAHENTKAIVPLESISITNKLNLGELDVVRNPVVVCHWHTNVRDKRHNWRWTWFSWNICHGAVVILVHGKSDEFWWITYNSLNTSLLGVSSVCIWNRSASTDICVHYDWAIPVRIGSQSCRAEFVLVTLEFERALAIVVAIWDRWNGTSCCIGIKNPSLTVCFGQDNITPHVRTKISKILTAKHWNTFISVYLPSLMVWHAWIRVFGASPIPESNNIGSIATPLVNCAPTIKNTTFLWYIMNSAFSIHANIDGFGWIPAQS